MSNILIVEDEVKIAETLIEYLMREGHEVCHTTTIAGALQSINSSVDLVILDLMLPDGDGETVCEKISETYNTPIIILTSKKSEQSRINGFSCGADDYLTKPFSPRELMARVKAVLKRSRPTDKIIKLDQDVVVHPSNHSVVKNGVEIKLTPNEFQILLCLANNPHKTVTRDKLMEYMHSSDSMDRTVDVHIRHLRQKLEDDPKSPKIVKTVQGYGYTIGMLK